MLISPFDSFLGMQNLRRLNLNSTKLSAEVYRSIKEQLPYLEQVDIRYTDAWWHTAIFTIVSFFVWFPAACCMYYNLLLFRMQMLSNTVGT
jgi:hypothetical protein